MPGVNSKTPQLDKTVAGLQRKGWYMLWSSALVLVGVLLLTVITQSPLLPGAAAVLLLAASSSVLYWAAYDLSRRLRQPPSLVKKAKTLAMGAFCPLVGAAIMLVATWSLG